MDVQIGHHLTGIHQEQDQNKENRGFHSVKKDGGLRHTCHKIIGNCDEVRLCCANQTAKIFSAF